MKKVIKFAQLHDYYNLRNVLEVNKCVQINRKT